MQLFVQEIQQHIKCKWATTYSWNSGCNYLAFQFLQQQTNIHCLGTTNGWPGTKTVTVTVKTTPTVSVNSQTILRR